MGAANTDIKSIFGHAMALSSAEERAAYLQQACAEDPELQAEIESLLQADRDAGSFLGEHNPCLVATVDERIMERPGSVIGPYKLLEQIGEGGFGVVFMAEQQRPIRRTVALKVLKPGMDTRQVIARFEAERQALALMDHPNIAKVLDAGQTSSGRPYFVMDLVKGLPIIEYCDQTQLTPRERLELFVSVCQAVQHAHQKGIIHRDIKPSNVLVTLHDGTPVPMVIDFGIAKALGQQLTDKTLITGFAQLIGTPLYMSPEQAALSGLDVDTRSDIYSLGVLLYELLTGTTPFDKERLQQVGYDEIRRIIREEEPPKPSTRISTLGRAATTVSTQRKSDPKRLRKLIRGELDWIVMKALEKDRNRRYETASAFAADVQRYLHDEPVQACPPSAMYRLRKFIRRHKGPVLAAGTVLLVVLASLAIVFRVRHQAALDQAATEEQARKRLELQLYYQTTGSAERERATGNSGRAEQLLDGPQCPEHLRGWEWHYLKRLRFGSAPPVRLGTHINCMALSKDGRWLAVGGRDGNLRLWDVKGWREVRPVSHGASIQGVAFSPNSRQVASAGEQSEVRVWEVETGRQVASLSHEGDATCVAYSPDGSRLLTGGTDGAFVWDANTGARLATLPGHAGTVLSVAFAPNGKLAATGGEHDRQVKVWDAATWQEIHSLRLQAGSAFSMVFHPDSTRLAVASGFLFWEGDDAEVRVWDAGTGETVHVLGGHQGAVLRLAFSPDGTRLATAGNEDTTIKIWDVASGLEILALRGHLDAVWAVAFSTDGHRLFSAGADQTLRIWDGTPLETDGGSLRTFIGHSARVTSVAFDRESVRLLSGGMDGAVRIWDLPTGRLVHEMTGLDGPVQGITFSPAGDMLAAVCWPGAEGASTKRQLRVWDSQTWRERPVPPLNLEGCIGAAFLPEGRRLVVADTAQIVTLENTTFLPGPVRYDHDDMLTGVSVHRDDRHAATSDVNGRISIWNLDDPRHVLAVFSSPSLDGLVNLHAALTAHPVQRFHAHETRVTGIAYSPTADLLASCAMDGAICLWDATTYKKLAELRGHTSGVRCLAFSPDGRWLVTGGNDATLRVWDVAQRCESFALRGHTKAVYAVAFSRDGRYIASGSLDKKVRVWDAQLPSLVRSAGAEQSQVPGSGQRERRVSPSSRMARLGDSK
jgi:WD40 repeat protein/serine/threonine protein kinase